MYVALSLPAFAVLVALCIEFLRVVAFPPLSLAVGLGEVAVIVLRLLHPHPGVAAVHTDAEWQTILLACLSPLAHDVALGTHVHRVPLLIGRVPEVKVVVVLAEGEEIACPHALVERHQRVGLPALGLPVAYELLHAIFRWVAKVLLVPTVLPMSVVVHVSGIPVAPHRLALRSPVRPYTKLSILEPLGTFPLFQALPIGSKLTGLYRHILGCTSCQGYCQDCTAQGSATIRRFHSICIYIGYRSNQRVNLPSTVNWPSTVAVTSQVPCSSAACGSVAVVRA